MGRPWTAISLVVSAASLAVAMVALDAAREAREASARRPSALHPYPPPPPDAPSPSPSSPASPVPAGEARPAAGVPPADPPLPATAAEFHERVLAIVQEAIDARESAAREAAPRESGGRPEGKDAPRGEGRKPPLSQVAAELDLDEGQRQAVHAAVLRGQEEMISVLRTPSEGGRVPLDDLLKVLLGPAEGQRERLVEVFGLLATEKVPGSGETYSQRVDAVKRATAEAFRRSFTPEQFKAYERTGQDPLEIQVPDSPWIQVLQEAWRRKP